MIYLGDCRDNIQVVAEQWANKLYDFMFKERKKKLRIKGRKRAYETYYEKMEGRVELSCMYREEKDYSLTILRWFKANFRTIVLAGEKELHEYSQISKLRASTTSATQVFRTPARTMPLSTPATAGSTALISLRSSRISARMKTILHRTISSSRTNI